MKTLSFDSAKGVVLLAVAGLAGFVLYKIYSIGSSAKDSVAATIGGIGDSINSGLAKVQQMAYKVKTSTPWTSPSDTGPGDDGEKVDQSPMVDTHLNDISPFMVGSASGALGGDNQAAGLALAQISSPDALQSVEGDDRTA